VFPPLLVNTFATTPSNCSVFANMRRCLRIDFLSPVGRPNFPEIFLALPRCGLQNGRLRQSTYRPGSSKSLGCRLRGNILRPIPVAPLTCFTVSLGAEARRHWVSAMHQEHPDDLKSIVTRRTSHELLLYTCRSTHELHIESATR
jgi:hypothetical protein